ncbi:uncharacterized protein LOC129594804 [Paramacrobiotus metropolitanus]|uniref:uncharacterized protein LOC129594804 n=1 Tax=Paramacrobiotus metropolitanus TaxID=2943436 RepID=UPI002446194F|nr:uncharacterized protein LOC129594804 [Paramacrobiotus metropolitanus]
MLVYDEDDRSQSMHAWNAVDVLVDGLLQPGKIINVAKNGLFIDFGSAGQRSEFVEYGRVFSSWRPLESVDAFKTPDVQALLRAGPDCPWTWYPVPGRIMSCGTESYLDDVYIVEAQLPHGPRRRQRAVVEKSSAPTALGRRLGGFRVRDKDCYTWQLPRVCSGESRVPFEILKESIFQEREVVCTKVLSDTLLYMQRCSERPLQLQELEKRYVRLGMEENHGDNGISGESFDRYSVNSPREERGVICVVFQHVPTELLVEIFQSQDSVDRVRCRRTCALWNTVLSTVIGKTASPMCGSLVEQKTTRPASSRPCAGR